MGEEDHGKTWGKKGRLTKQGEAAGGEGNG
jgi:hypothetical protein